MLELAGSDALLLAFYAAFVSGNFTVSLLFPLVGLPLFVASLYSVCLVELVAHPLVLLVLLPLVVLLGGAIGAAVALAMQAPPLLHRLGTPSLIGPGDGGDFVWSTRLAAAAFALGLLGVARGAAGFVRDCEAHGTAASIGFFAVGLIVALAALGALALCGLADTARRDATDVRHLLYFALIQSAPLVYFCIQADTVGAAAALVGVLLLGVLVAIAGEARWAGAARYADTVDDPRYAASWQKSGVVLRRWFAGLFLPLALTWLAGWIANRVTEGSTVNYRASVTMAVLTGACVIALGVCVAAFYVAPVGDMPTLPVQELPRRHELEARQAATAAATTTFSSTAPVGGGFVFNSRW